jgi:hypothetical protein
MTAAEIRARITRLDQRIEAAEDVASYQIDSGQSSRRVSRAKLESLYTAREYWEQKLKEAIASEGGDSGIMHINFRRP